MAAGAPSPPEQAWPQARQLLASALRSVSQPLLGSPSQSPRPVGHTRRATLGASGRASPGLRSRSGCVEVQATTARIAVTTARRMGDGPPSRAAPWVAGRSGPWRNEGQGSRIAISMLSMRVLLQADPLLPVETRQRIAE